MSAYQGQTHFSNLITHGENLAGFMNMQVLPRIDRNSRWDAVMVGPSRMDDPISQRPVHAGPDVPPPPPHAA